MKKNNITRRLALISVLILRVMNAEATEQAKSKAMPNDTTAVEVPLAGNSYKTNANRSGGHVSNLGVVDWTDKKSIFQAFVRIKKPGKLQLWIRQNPGQGTGSLEIEAAGKRRSVKLNQAAEADSYAGEWNIRDTGYVTFTIRGLDKTGQTFASLKSFILKGEATRGIAFVKNNEGNFFYWGRRGPSVHLGYQVPNDLNTEWFYNEVTVNPGMDVIGSYFMANGFGEGYFGMQVNSENERRVLFSVWSPFSTDDPKLIPEDQKIKMLSKGKDVHTGEFGNEGSGGQSYLRFNWKAGQTYKFLLNGKPDGHNSSTYTAYFYDPENAKWLLIASFKRPKTHTYLKRLHSFLENFNPETGYIGRKVQFSNQWVCAADGKWMELDKAIFTVDNTARMGYRMDYGGGTEGSSFYLKDCGFFSDYTVPGKKLSRTNNPTNKPQLNLIEISKLSH